MPTIFILSEYFFLNNQLRNKYLHRWFFCGWFFKWFFCR